MIDREQAEIELRNWGRCMNDSWLEHHILHRPPPTSEQYVAPYPPEPEDSPPPPVDELEAQRTTDIVVLIGMDHIDAYRVLVRWYCHILMTPHLTHSQGLKRLSRFMHTSYPGAVRMLEEGIARYRQYRLHEKRARGLC